MWKMVWVKRDQEKDLYHLCHELMSEQEKQIHEKLHPRNEKLLGL